MARSTATRLAAQGLENDHHAGECCEGVGAARMGLVLVGRPVPVDPHADIEAATRTVQPEGHEAG
jgi:hypothetical protein